MFALFFNLYQAMFIGQWNQLTYAQIVNGLKSGLNVLGTFLTSIFGEKAVMNNLGDISGEVIYITSFTLALITSIGIVVMAVKGVKRAFGIFFMGIRR